MEIIPVKALKDNYIWCILDETSKQAVIVDPGESDPVLQYLKQHGYAVAGILVTHHHGDHTHGIAGILETAGNIPVFGSNLSPNTHINHPLKDGDSFTCAHVRGKALAIPGHTLDHTAYYYQDANALFTGDTLFSAGCGRIFEGTPDMMLSSLKKLSAFADDTKVYCGHEYTQSNLRFAQHVEPRNLAIKHKLENLSEVTLPSTMGEEQTFNPFLRYHVAEVIHAAEQHLGRRLSSDVEVFAAIREWKNNF